MRQKNFHWPLPIQVVQIFEIEMVGANNLANDKIEVKPLHILKNMIITRVST
jgi:hypothetical protein